MGILTADFWEVFLVLAATVTACSTLGSFLVLRRMALLTDAIGHVLLLGIVVAFLIVRDLNSIWLILGASLAGLATVALVEAISRSQFVREDAAIGLVFPALFALGIVLTTMFVRNTHLDVDRVLFGSPELAPDHRLETTEFDFGPVGLVTMSIMAIVNLAVVMTLYKEFKLSTFDAALAATLGFVPGVLHYVLMGLVSLTAVTAFDAAGPVLVVAFFVVPSATAYLLVDRLALMILLSIAIGLLGTFVGCVVAVAAGTPYSGTIASMLGGLFGLAFMLSPRHGMLATAVRRSRQRRDFFDTLLAIHLLQHEDTEREVEESRVSELHLHMHWAVAATMQVVRRARSRSWVDEVDGRLRLTDAGREHARRSLL